MEHKIFKVKNEIELLRITALLAEQNIPYSVKRLGDSSFPALDQEFGEIIVAQEHADAVTRTIGNSSAISPDLRSLHSQGKPDGRRFATNKPKARFWMLAIYAIVVTLICLRFAYIQFGVELSKNFNYKWSWDGTILRTNHKSTQKLVGESYDQNFNINFERVLQYDKSGLLLDESYDLDEDGFIESVYGYNTKNELTERLFDSDNDGRVDRFEIVMENKDTLIFVDRNKNGYFEMSPKSN